MGLHPKLKAASIGSQFTATDFRDSPARARYQDSACRKVVTLADVGQRFRFCFGAPLPSILRVLTTETSPALGASHRHYMGYLDLHSALLRSTLSVWAFVLAVALPLDRELVRFYVVLRLP